MTRSPCKEQEDAGDVFCLTDAGRLEKSIQPHSKQAKAKQAKANLNRLATAATERSGLRQLFHGSRLIRATHPA
ncbi:MAG: hypothetical protein ABGZ35_01835 [Planctomycetaceae bacterium]